MTLLYDLITSDTDSFLRLNSKLEISGTTRECGVLLAAFFPEHHFSDTSALPQALAEWVQMEIQKRGDSYKDSTFKAVTTFSRHGRVLIAILFHHPKLLDLILCLEEDTSALKNYEGVKRQLTKRQFEMYRHIKDGERSITSIAKKMGISVRTAEGHKMNLQRIITDL